MKKPPLLFLCHRIPFPPNKGDKIRSFHLLEYLSSKYAVYLGCFIDNMDDEKYIIELDNYCEESFTININPTSAKIMSLMGLFHGEPLTLPYYKNSRMQEWVDNLINTTNPSNILVFSSAMAQYIRFNENTDKNVVVDFVDVDSDKWKQYSVDKIFPLNWLYKREATKLLKYEKYIANRADYSFFVSSCEANYFTKLIDNTDKNKIDYFNNGVNIDHFNLSSEYPIPFEQDEKNIVFTGAMDYWPNIDAACWFVEDIYPLLKSKIDNIHFYIVGSSPVEKIIELGKINDITVTGTVEDIRPYIYHADVIVAPMRIARGVQNKVLEGMSMAKTVITTSKGLEGIDAEIDIDVFVTDDSEAFADKIFDVLDNMTSINLGKSARSNIENNYLWSTTLKRLESKLE
ncbi:MAG: TIGR03087 family PEP-CTERM/XrtA system glycosyltransferase [Candidatus Brocadiaceae bacterium]|nr:TIGR03087 family PEP-CTERM/XrtA system glycosyltransferase [Candidatus Brocadiaceae bacterium]